MGGPILITGGNRGIGLEAVKVLAKAHPDTLILMGSRDVTSAQKAIDKIKHENPALESAKIEPLQLDVQDDASVKQAAATVKDKYGKLQVLLNNAGVVGEDADYVLGVNYWGVKRVTETFLPLIPRDGSGKVVTVSSEVGTWTHNEFSGKLRETLDHPETLSIPELDKLVETYTKAAKAKDTATLAQFPSGEKTYGPYGISKAFVSTWGRIRARELKEEQVAVILVCPGYCATELNGNSGYRTATEGGESVVYATALGLESTGKFFGHTNKEAPMAQAMPANFGKPEE